jgi:hypothetical protein
VVPTEPLVGLLPLLLLPLPLPLPLHSSGAAFGTARSRVEGGGFDGLLTRVDGEP